MKTLRMTALVLAVVQTVLAGLTALVGAFADGADVWSRVVVVLLHPLCAAVLLLLALMPRPSSARALVIGALLMANVIVDLSLAMMIARGDVKGDWWLPVMFAVIPSLGVVYALTLARTASQPRPG